MFLFSNFTYLVQLLYLGKLWRPKYQQKLNKIMKISQEDVILIKKYLSVKAVWCTKAVEWIVRQGLETLKHRQFGEQKPQDGYKCPATRRLSRSSEGPCAQSGGHAKKASVTSLDFAWNCHSLFKCIQKNNSIFNDTIRYDSLGEPSPQTPPRGFRPYNYTSIIFKRLTLR